MAEQHPHESMKMPKKDVLHFAPVANYYGTPYITLRDGTPVIGIEDAEGTMEKPVSRAFYDAWLQEFEGISPDGSTPSAEDPDRQNP